MENDEISQNIERGKEFIRDRITDFRMKLGVSEYQMSLELGQNRGYIQSISSGKAMPSLSGFLNICDYFQITPREFFDNSVEEPTTLNELYNVAKLLPEKDLRLLISIADRLSSDR